MVFSINSDTYEWGLVGQGHADYSAENGTDEFPYYTEKEVGSK